jgi:hypothetical protein
VTVSLVDLVDVGVVADDLSVLEVGSVDRNRAVRVRKHAVAVVEAGIGGRYDLAAAGDVVLKKWKHGKEKAAVVGDVE